MPPSRIIRGLTGGTAVVALMLTGACSGEGGTSGGSDASGSSAGQGTAAAPALTRENIGEQITGALHRSGSFRFRIASSAGGHQVKAHGEGTFRDGRPASHTTMEIGGQDLEVIVVDGVYYLKTPLMGTAKPWLKIDPDAKSGLGASLGRLGGAGDPGSSVKVLSDASKVQRVGNATVAGVETTHYRVEVPRKALTTAMHYPQQVVAMLPEQIRYDIWVDSLDRPRRMTAKMHVGSQTATTRITLGSFGAPVKVEAPPAGKVTTSAGGSSSGRS